MEPEEKKKSSLDPAMRELSWEIREVVEEILAERFDELAGVMRSGFEGVLERLSGIERRLQEQLKEIQVSQAADVSPQVEAMQGSLSDLGKEIGRIQDTLETFPLEEGEDDGDDSDKVDEEEE